jgi:hypothetical protein
VGSRLYGPTSDATRSLDLLSHGLAADTSSERTKGMTASEGENIVQSLGVPFAHSCTLWWRALRAMLEMHTKVGLTRLGSLSDSGSTL